MKNSQSMIRTSFALIVFLIAGCSSDRCEEVHLGFQDWGDGSAELSVANFSENPDPVEIEILLLRQNGTISDNKTIRLVGGARHDETVNNSSMENIRVLCEGETVER